MGWDTGRQAMPDSRGTYLQTPQKGNLTNYGKTRNHVKSPDPEADKAPQTYVRMMLEFSYDTPRPDPEGALRRECGAAIRRAVEAKLTSEGLAAQIGDATLTLRSMMMRQEESLEAFEPKPEATNTTGANMVLVDPDNPEEAAAALRAGFGIVRLGPEYMLDPEGNVVRRPEARQDIRGPLMGDGSERRWGVFPPGEDGRSGTVVLPGTDAEGVTDPSGYTHAYKEDDEDDEDVPPNAGSAQ